MIKKIHLRKSTKLIMMENKIYHIKSLKVFYVDKYSIGKMFKVKYIFLYMYNIYLQKNRIFYLSNISIKKIFNNNFLIKKNMKL